MMDNLLHKSVFSCFIKLPIHAVWKLISTVKAKRIQEKVKANLKKHYFSCNPGGDLAIS